MDNTTAPATPTAKRSFKKINEAATAHGWSLASVETPHTGGIKVTWTLDNPDAYTEVAEKTRSHDWRRIPVTAEATFDAETHAWYGGSLRDADGDWIRVQDTTVGAFAERMTYPHRQEATLRAQREREAAAEIRHAEREQLRDGYLASLDDYRVRSLARTAADEPTLDIEPGTRPNDMLRKVQAHAERHAAWRIANLAQERHGWPKADGSHIDIGEAVAMAATEMMASGSWDYRDLEASLMSACSEMMRDYRTRD